MKEIVTSRGDGDRITLTDDELLKDIIEGSEDAARKGKIDGLSQADINHLADIFRQPGRTVSVEPGKEVVVSDEYAGNIIAAAAKSSADKWAWKNTRGIVSKKPLANAPTRQPYWSATSR